VQIEAQKLVEAETAQARELERNIAAAEVSAQQQAFPHGLYTAFQGC
jgi:hypothetical protein